MSTVDLHPYGFVMFADPALLTDVDLEVLRSVVEAHAEQSLQSTGAHRYGPWKHAEPAPMWHAVDPDGEEVWSELPRSAEPDGYRVSVSCMAYRLPQPSDNHQG